MNHIYIGDRQLEPPEDIECELCDGFKIVSMPFWGDDSSSDEWREVPCPDCQADRDLEPDNDPAK